MSLERRSWRSRWRSRAEVALYRAGRGAARWVRGGGIARLKKPAAVLVAAGTLFAGGVGVGAEIGGAGDERRAENLQRAYLQAAELRAQEARRFDACYARARANEDYRGELIRLDPTVHPGARYRADVWQECRAEQQAEVVRLGLEQ